MNKPTVFSAVTAMFAQAHAHSHGHGHGHGHEEVHGHLVDHIQVSKTSTVFRHLENHLFPFDARYNSLLATLIIQLMPCIVVQVVPGFRGGEGSLVLSTLVAFALGTLLGDVLLHLIPEIFADVSTNATAHLDGLVLGTAIFGGFLLFLCLDKCIRIVSQNAEGGIHSHSHSSSHSHSHSHDSTAEKQNTPSPLLNVATGFIHNATDGVALASSFYSSRHVGITTTIAVVFHEIPHELGDFAILLSNGFTFPQAVRSQMVTSLGALLGTAIGCVLNEMPMKSSGKYLAVGGVEASELLLPTTAGAFIYLASVGVVPQLLSKSSQNKMQEFKKWALQLIAIIVGFLFMGLIAFAE